MSKKITLFTFILWFLALVVWQILFYNHPVISEILWEIHTIFTSVILFYFILNWFINEPILDLFKIGFRIIFKVWLIIFIAFSMHNSFNQKGFILTSTFIFGYLEGLIDINAWLRNCQFSIHSKIKILSKTKLNKILLSIISISIIHVLCAFLALLFFNIG